MKRKNFGRMLMAISAVGVTLSINSFCFANSVTDAQNQLNSIKNQINANKSQISAVESEVQGYLDEIETLDGQIATYTEKMNNIQTKIDTNKEQDKK